MSLPDGQLEWLETNRLGSFCFSCVDRKLRRRYHALLTVRDPGLGDPWNVLAETCETLIVDGESRLLADPLGAESAHQAGARGTAQLEAFSATPHARHSYRLRALQVERRVQLSSSDALLAPGTARGDQVEVLYRVRNVQAPIELRIAPLLRCRPLHELTRENPFLDGTCIQLGDEVRMLPYAGMPAIALRIYGARARFVEHGAWHAVTYPWEAARGYAASEALFSPGCFSIELTQDCEFTFVLGLHRVHPPELRDANAQDASSASAHAQPPASLGSRAEPHAASLGSRAEPHASFGSRLGRAAGQFFATSSSLQHGIITGYPWFGVSSRASLVALPGHYLATGSWECAEAVLNSLANARVRGLIPNRPAFAGSPVDTCAVDTSLLFVRAVQWFKEHVGEARVAPFMPIVCELLESLAEGTDPRMRFDRGVSIYTEPGPCPLTWMDARADGRPVTPRAGYAVEIDALAYNAVHFACAWADGKRPGFARTFRNRLRNAEGEFVARYWDDARGYLADTHDGERPDPRLRPNQLWALALPHRPLPTAMALSTLRAVTRELWTPVGLRTLSPQDADYRGHYGGNEAQRELAYHQGSVWPWLTGIYADATFALLGRAALDEHVAPILARMSQHVHDEGCIGQVSELFDGDAPHGAGGAPAHAMSVAELYRVQHMLEAAGALGARGPSADTSLRLATQKRSAHGNQYGKETLSK